MERITDKPFFRITLWLLLFGYFYNLPIVGYSIKGDNELRLFDLLGIVIFYQYFINYSIVSTEIRKIIFFRRFQYFLIYCSFSILLTLVFSILYDRILWFVQSFLYLYHMWVFFLGAVFLYFSLSNKSRFRQFLTFFIVLVIAEGVLVILQNLGIVPFLWSETYRLGYHGFLSGTFGPNKIVLGMSMLISFICLIGINSEKKLKHSKILIYTAITIAAVCILLSGSRTSYVGAIFFLLYFLLTKTGNFVVFGIIGSILFGVLLFNSPLIADRISATIEDRVTYAIDSPEDITSYEDFTGVYEELGAGRAELHMKYVHYLLNNPLVIPFGRGFNNRLGVGSSAHNMYLSLINEVGLVGLILFLRWMLSFMVIVKRKMPGLRLALNGMIVAILVTLYFGEHLYVYRPLFGILGFFMMICVMLTVPLRKSP